LRVQPVYFGPIVLQKSQSATRLIFRRKAKRTAVPVRNLIRLASDAESRNASVREACSLIWSVLVLLSRSRASLEAEILILRHQFNIHRRHLPERLTFSIVDRLIFAGLYRLVPSTLQALTLVKPETVVRWHRAGFRSLCLVGNQIRT
jgi:hypothetical protein